MLRPLGPKPRQDALEPIRLEADEAEVKIAGADLPKLLAEQLQIPGAA